MKKTLQVILSVLEIVMYTTGILVSAKTLVELAHSDECENNTEEASPSERNRFTLKRGRAGGGGAAEKKQI